MKSLLVATSYQGTNRLIDLTPTVTFKEFEKKVKSHWGDLKTKNKTKFYYYWARNNDVQIRVDLCDDDSLRTFLKFAQDCIVMIESTETTITYPTPVQRSPVKTLSPAKQSSPTKIQKPLKRFSSTPSPAKIKIQPTNSIKSRLKDEAGVDYKPPSKSVYASLKPRYKGRFVSLKALERLTKMEPAGDPESGSDTDTEEDDKESVGEGKVPRLSYEDICTAVQEHWTSVGASSNRTAFKTIVKALTFVAKSLGKRTNESQTTVGRAIRDSFGPGAAYKAASERWYAVKRRPPGSKYNKDIEWIAAGALRRVKRPKPNTPGTDTNTGKNNADSVESEEDGNEEALLDVTGDELREWLTAGWTAEDAHNSETKFIDIVKYLDKVARQNQKVVEETAFSVVGTAIRSVFGNVKRRAYRDGRVIIFYDLRKLDSQPIKSEPNITKLENDDQLKEVNSVLTKRSRSINDLPPSRPSPTKKRLRREVQSLRNSMSLSETQYAQRLNSQNSGQDSVRRSSRLHVPPISISYVDTDAHTHTHTVWNPELITSINHTSKNTKTPIETETSGLVSTDEDRDDVKDEQSSGDGDEIDIEEIQERNTVINQSITSPPHTPKQSLYSRTFKRAKKLPIRDPAINPFHKRSSYPTP